MKKFIEKIGACWYLYFTGILLLMQALVFLIFRENSYIQTHDNLDLFMAHYEMMKRQGAFFAQNVKMPMLHGIDRDLLGSEFLIYTFCMLFCQILWHIWLVIS